MTALTPCLVTNHLAMPWLPLTSVYNHTQVCRCRDLNVSDSICHVGDVSMSAKPSLASLVLATTYWDQQEGNQICPVRFVLCVRSHIQWGRSLVGEGKVVLFLKPQANWCPWNSTGKPRKALMTTAQSPGAPWTSEHPLAKCTTPHQHRRISRVC